MEWYLLRKPYPGLTQEERVDIVTEEMHFGRGRDCDVFCLSMYVSRRHLKLTVKDKCLSIMDLGSSNGTFINESRINPNVQVSLSAGDEVGIGNINVDSKDCYVYKVCSLEESSDQKDEKPENTNPERVEDIEKDSGIEAIKIQLPERGSKRSAVDEPEIVIIEDDGDEDKKVKLDQSHGALKRQRIDDDSNPVKLCGVNPTNMESCNQSKTSCPPTCPEVLIKAEMNGLGGKDDDGAGINAVSRQQNAVLPSEGCEDRLRKSSKRTSSDDAVIERTVDNFATKSMPPPPVPLDVNVKPPRFSDEGSFPKLLDGQLSALMDSTTDTSVGTIKISSPALGLQSSSTSLNCSTPVASKIAKPEDVKPMLTSTPSIFKSEIAGTLHLKTDINCSPIAKAPVGNSTNDSSANYTLEEEMIVLSDDDDDDDGNIPCSQMFAEEDVKPSPEDLEKAGNVVDLSSDDEPDMNREGRDDELDHIVLVSSDEDDDNENETVLRWHARLSQTLIKDEPMDEPEAPKITSPTVFDHLESDEEIWGDLDFFLNESEKESRNVEETNENLKVGRKTEDSVKSMAEEYGSKNSMVKVVEEQAQSAAEFWRKQDAESNATESKKKKEESQRNKEKIGLKKEESILKDGTREKNSSHKSKSSSKSSHSEKPHRSNYVKTNHDRNKKVVEKLKETFGDSSSDEEASKNSDKPRFSLKKDDRNRKHKKPNNVPSSDECDVSRKRHKEEPPLGSEAREVKVTLQRLELTPVLREQIKKVSSPSNPPIAQKSTRKIELVEALPNPPRRACNRGISMDSALKSAQGSSSTGTSGPSTKSSKVTERKDKATSRKEERKEKLAKIAEQRLTKERGNLEVKRTAAAKIKMTSSNRGSFLTEADEIEASKPKSRKDVSKSKELKRIPKLKDKAAVDLPTKSPLQLDKSWEKGDASVPAPSAPVEIPTGPQPKRRIAQTPNPIFYSDLDDKSGQPPAPLPLLQPKRSCLSGSSKHNIALNNSKEIPLVPKKKVRFKENLTEVRWIPGCANAKPVTSVKNADRPRSMSEISLAVPKMPSDETALQDVVYDILKWNPLWLKEEKNLPTDVLPPVVANMNLPDIPKTEFLDFEEYHDTMYPFLMLELWSGLSKEYNSHQGDSRGSMFMAVDSASSAPVSSRPDRLLATLQCHMLIGQRRDGKNANDHPRLGNLVIIDLTLLEEQSGKRIVIPVFGYVTSDKTDRLRKDEKFHRELQAHCPNPQFKVRFSLFIRERKNLKFVLEKPMRVKNAKYIRGDLRVFQAIKNLYYMPLKYSIISPSAANEDFTLPDISEKLLAYPDQLNPTQEQIVLQTAEVCQQQAPKICLIQGPPGTGKTHVIASLVVQLLYRDGMYTRSNREKGLVPRILLCAPSNNAVDLLVRRLLQKRRNLSNRFKMVRVGQVQYMHPDVQRISLQELAKLDVVRQDQAAHDRNTLHRDISTYRDRLRDVQNEIAKLSDHNMRVSQELTFQKGELIRKLKVLEDRQRQQAQNLQTFSKPNPALEYEAMRKILRGADIVATTLTSCVVRTMETVFPPPSQGKYHFQVCIVDEATQCLEVETLIPLLLGVKTLVLVGDPNQLPATILSKVAREKGLGTSLFARLEKVIPEAVQKLDTQYRMHPEILRWPNRYFYCQRLKSPDSIKSCRESRVLPYCVLSLPFVQDPRGESNCDEAKLVVQLAELLKEKKAIAHNDFKVGIITPYQSQRRMFDKMLQDRTCRDIPEVQTIDSCQGQEKDVIILSCVRTNGIGFLSDRQRINVALTRAKYALFICGNFSSLDRDSMWNSLLTDARHRKCLYDIRDHLNNNDLWNYIKKK